MKLTNADIYTENTITGQITNFKSLKQACNYISNLSYSDKKITLICIGNWNLDYTKQTETEKEYYNRLLKMVKKI